jgi:hypothetical protein
MIGAPVHLRLRERTKQLPEKPYNINIAVLASFIAGSLARLSDIIARPIGYWVQDWTQI